MKDFWWSETVDPKSEDITLSRINLYGYHRFHNFELFRRGTERDDGLLLVTVGGNPQLCYKNTRAFPKRGNVTLYLTGEDHRFKADTWEAYWSHFYPSKQLLKLLAHYGITEGLTFDYLLSEREIEEWEAIFTCAKLPVELAAHCCALLVEQTIMRCLNIQHQQAEIPTHMRLRDVMNFINTHPEIRHSVISLAAVSHLSSSRFAHVFKDEYGKSVQAYITEVRIERAKYLLKATILTAAQIASELGYFNPYHFYSVFKKITGYPPAKYKAEKLR